MEKNNITLFIKGMKNGFPIFLGYLAVSFTLGILAHGCGLSPFQATITSLTVNASAGEYAGFTLMGANGSYLEMMLVIFVANMRYMLMSASLSQRIQPATKLLGRMAIGFGITDEIFGVAIATEDQIRPVYYYGIMTSALPGWALGTLLGVVMGDILPSSAVSALNIGLYAMFIAIIIPMGRKHKTIAVLIVISMVSSYFCSILPVISKLSTGNRTILLTILIAGAAAIIKPLPKEVTNETG